MDSCLEDVLFKLVQSDDNVEKIRKLLADGADPNYQIFDGRTLFHIAAESKQDNVEVVEELISSGANINLYDAFGYTALHYAVMQQKYYVVEELLLSGAFVNAKTSHGSTPLHLAIKAFADTPEHQVHDTSVIEELLDHKYIDYNARDSRGNTPLMVAVKEEEEDIVQLLLNKKANPDISNNLSETPLHVAFADELDFIALELLRVGATIYAVNKDNKTPLDIFFENKTIDDPFSSAQTVLKFIAFRYHVTEDIKQKLQRFPNLLQRMEKWCEEVNRMRSDILIYDTTFHDFILNCYQDPENPQYPESLVSEMHKCIIERFIMGLYPNYFLDLLVCVPASSLREVLLTTVKGRKNSKWCNDPELFSNIDITYLMSLYLHRLDLFCLILSLSNARLPESMQNIRVREYS